MTKTKEKKLKLKRDVVIRAGTVLKSNDNDRELYSVSIGLTRNGYGNFIYSIERDDKDFGYWFEEI